MPDEEIPVLIVGGPHSTQGGLFNCGFVLHRGKVLGVVPKSYLPEYREYYEERQFRAAREFLGQETTILGQTVPGASFTVGELRLPRATLGLLAGFAFGVAGVTFQTMLRNPLASPDIIGTSSGGVLGAPNGDTGTGGWLLGAPKGAAGGEPKGAAGAVG